MTEKCVPHKGHNNNDKGLSRTIHKVQHTVHWLASSGGAHSRGAAEREEIVKVQQQLGCASPVKECEDQPVWKHAKTAPVSGLTCLYSRQQWLQVF